MLGASRSLPALAGHVSSGRAASGTRIRGQVSTMATLRKELVVVGSVNAGEPVRRTREWVGTHACCF